MDLSVFGKRLKEARTDNKMSQKELSALAGVSTVMISSYERSDEKGGNPSLANAAAIANALNVSLDWLCGLSDVNTNTTEIDFLMRFIEDSIYFGAENSVVEKSGPRGTLSILEDGYGNLIWNIPMCDTEAAREIIDDIFRITEIIKTGFVTDEILHVLIENVYRKHKTTPLTEIFVNIPNEHCNAEGR